MEEEVWSNTPENITDEFLNEMIDPGNLAMKWFTVRTPYPVVTILCIYLVVVLKLGPEFMKNREPYTLSYTLRVYNFFQVVANSIFVLRCFTDFTGLKVLFRVTCNITNHEAFIEQKNTFMFYGWLLLCLKMVDLLDTVFMVLKKKYSHVTFLHVYHHSAIVFFGWLSLRYMKTYHVVMPAMLNAAVHTIMYSYYLLATYPSFRKYLWWKKHLTKIQLGQFALVIIYFSFMYYFQCYIPRMFTYVWIFNVAVIAALFVNFYYKAYTDKNKTN